MQKRGSKSESTQKTEQDRFCWKNFTMVKVNGQRSKSTVNDLVKVKSQWLTRANVAVWRHLRAYVAVHEMEQAHGSTWERGNWRVRCVGTRERYWRRVWCSFWPFLVGFCLGLAVLSLYAFALAVGWAERWYPRVVGTVGVTAMTCF